MRKEPNQHQLVADLLTNLSEQVNRLRQKESEQKMTIEELANEIDQLRQAKRRQQLTINRLNSEIGDLQAENTRLLEVIRLQAATQLELPAGVEIVAQDAVLPGLEL